MWYLLDGGGKNCIRLVSVYNLGRHTREGLATVYQQHIRYLQQNNMEYMIPCKLLQEDLLRQLKLWVDQKDGIALIIDTNEHVLNGPLCKELTSNFQGLGLVKVFNNVWNNKSPNTYRMTLMVVW